MRTHIFICSPILFMFTSFKRYIIVAWIVAALGVVAQQAYFSSLSEFRSGLVEKTGSSFASADGGKYDKPHQCEAVCSGTCYPVDGGFLDGDDWRCETNTSKENINGNKYDKRGACDALCGWGSCERVAKIGWDDWICRHASRPSGSNNSNNTDTWPVVIWWWSASQPSTPTPPVIVLPTRPSTQPTKPSNGCHQSYQRGCTMPDGHTQGKVSCSGICESNAPVVSNPKQPTQPEYKPAPRPSTPIIVTPIPTVPVQPSTPIYKPTPTPQPKSTCHQSQGNACTMTDGVTQWRVDCSGTCVFTWASSCHKSKWQRCTMSDWYTQGTTNCNGRCEASARYTPPVIKPTVRVPVYTPRPIDPCHRLWGDSDGDGVCNFKDNCPQDRNKNQQDTYGSSAKGDACEVEPIPVVRPRPQPSQPIYKPQPQQPVYRPPVDPCAGRGWDSDNDGVCNDRDNCPYTHNPDQRDTYGTSAGNVCEAYPQPVIVTEPPIYIPPTPPTREVPVYQPTPPVYQPPANPYPNCYGQWGRACGMWNVCNTGYVMDNYGECTRATTWWGVTKSGNVCRDWFEPNGFGGCTRSDDNYWKVNGGMRDTALRNQRGGW